MERLLNWINKLGYAAYNNLTLNSFEEAVKDGVMSTAYTHIISWLSHELQRIENYESCINSTKDITEIASFQVELSTFLREVECPYLTETLDFAKSSNFGEREWLLILDFLVGELAAAKLYHAKLAGTQELEIQMPETDVAKSLRESLQTLSISKPPPNVTGVQLFSKMDSRVRENLQKNPQIAKEPLFKGTLTEKQWEALDDLNNEMQDDYRCRREVLLKRLDVTLQSFKWGETGKKRCKDIEKLYEEWVSPLSTEPNVSVADILAAREDILEEEKTSGSSVREKTKSLLNQVIIGAVPDRGGRPEDQQPPPPEIPSWKTGPKPANVPGSMSTHGSNRGNSYAGNATATTGPRYSGANSDTRSDYGNRSYRSNQGSFDSSSSDSTSGRGSVYRNPRGRGGPESGSDRQRGRGGSSYASDYDSRSTGSYGGNGPLKHNTPNRPYMPGDAMQAYSENSASLCNHNIAHVESAYIPGYTQQTFQPVYQPSMGFGGYGPLPGVGLGGYGASGGNYEQNAPFIQSYSSGRGPSRQPRGGGGRGPRRGGGGRHPRDGY